MDRKLLKFPFRLTKLPGWECPTCNKGLLRLKDNSFVKNESSTSRSHHSHDAWEPTWIDYTYSCTLECTNDKCKEIVTSVGTGSVSEEVSFDHEGMPELDYWEFFKPKYFEPPLSLMSIPEECPASVSAPLHESFKLFFASPSAASNSVRVAIEELLTDLKVKRFDTINGKRRYINLHQRIDLIPAKFLQHKEMFQAVKWLGNAGSHGGNEVTTDDVLDAYELTSHILEQIYAPKTTDLIKLAKKVNKNKGPVKKK